MINRTSVTVLACGLAGAGLAKTSSETTALNVPGFEDLDRDRTGTISRPEARSYPKLEQIFSLVDSDRDGELLPTEYDTALRMIKG